MSTTSHGNWCHPHTQFPKTASTPPPAGHHKVGPVNVSDMAPPANTPKQTLLIYPHYGFLLDIFVQKYPLWTFSVTLHYTIYRI